MPQMTISITNIFNAPNKFITVKRIILLIELFIFTPKRIKCFILLLLIQSSIQSIDFNNELNMMFSI